MSKQNPIVISNNMVAAGKKVFHAAMTSTMAPLELHALMCDIYIAMEMVKRAEDAQD